MPRNPNPLPTFELWLLGRLGVGEPVVVPLLEDVSTIKAIDAVDLLGRAHLGGWRVPAPRTGTKGFPRADVMRTGFDILSRGTDALEALFESIAAQGAGKVGPQGCQWGLQQMFGWLYYALHYASRKPDQLEAIGIAAATVAHRRGTFGRTATSLPSVVEPLACLHQHEVGRAIGIEVRFVNAIALRLGIEPVPSHDRFVMYEATAVSLIQEALARSLKRSDAARALGLDKTELDALVRMGRIQPLCRLGGTTAADDLYRTEDIQALLPGLDLPLQSPNTEPLLTLAGYARALGLPRSEIIEMWAIGRLRPVARVTGQTGFSALAFEPPTAKEINGVRPSARKPGGRFRRQRARPGLTKCDAASLLGISMPTLAELMRRGYVSSLGHEATGTSRTRVDEHSLRAFAMQYASAVTYADVLGCGRTYTVEKLRQLGVEIILKEPGHGHLMAMVRRSDVTSALGLDRDPLTTTSSGWIGFWSAFGEHLASKGSIFRLVRITSEPNNRLQSGDRRTVISIEMDAEGRSILRQETGHGANEGTFAVREGFALQNRRSWPQLFVWLETSAYLLRSAGGRGSAAA